MFKNESGDDAYGICHIDNDATEEEIKRVVENNIGDDFSDGQIYGEYWVMKIETALSELMVVNESLPRENSIRQLKMVRKLMKGIDIGDRISNLEKEGENLF